MPILLMKESKGNSKVDHLEASYFILYSSMLEMKEGWRCQQCKLVFRRMFLVTTLKNCNIAPKRGRFLQTVP